MLKAIFLSSPNGGYFTKQILDRKTRITLLRKSFCFSCFGNSPVDVVVVVVVGGGGITKAVVRRALLIEQIMNHFPA